MGYLLLIGASKNTLFCYSRALAPVDPVAQRSSKLYDKCVHAARPSAPLAAPATHRPPASRPQGASHGAHMQPDPSHDSAKRRHLNEARIFIRNLLPSTSITKRLRLCPLEGVKRRKTLPGAGSCPFMQNYQGEHRVREVLVMSSTIEKVELCLFSSESKPYSQCWPSREGNDT